MAKPKHSAGELTQQIGWYRGTLPKVDTDNRGQVRNWLRAHVVELGLTDPGLFVNRATCGQMLKYYNDTTDVHLHNDIAGTGPHITATKPDLLTPTPIFDEAAALAAHQAKYQALTAAMAEDDEQAVYYEITGRGYVPVHPDDNEPDAGWVEVEADEDSAEYYKSILKQKETETTMTAAATTDQLAALQLLMQTLTPKVEIDEATVVRLVKQHAATLEDVANLIDAGLKNIKRDSVVLTIQTQTESRTLPDAVYHPIFTEVLQAVADGENVMLVGPAGSGKTTLAEQVANALGLGFAMAGAVDSPYKLTGYMDAQGRYVRTRFRDAYQNGGLFLLDEVDASHPGVLLVLNAAIENGNMDFPDGMIERHPDFHIMAAANTYGLGADRIYVGRNQLDGATLNRFYTFAMAYDHRIEDLAGHDQWVAYVRDARRAATELDVRSIISPRSSFKGAKALRRGEDPRDVANRCLWQGVKADQRAKIESAMSVRLPAKMGK